MKDINMRDKGTYKEEYSTIIYGMKVHVIETTVVGRNSEILNFSREYNPPIPYVLQQSITM